MVMEEFPAVFYGEHTVTIGIVRVEDGNVWFRRPNKYIPWISKFVRIASNVVEHMKEYDAVRRYDIKDGRTEEIVRVYNFDIDTFRPNFAKMNPDQKKTFDSMVAERNYLVQKVYELMDMVKTMGQGDLLREKFKDDYGFFTGLRPGYLNNTGGDKDKKK